jgi:putative transposase
MAHRRPPRIRGFPYTGLYRYSLTFGTHRRLRLFTDRLHVESVLGQIRRTCDDEQFALLAYCFMPDHVHVVAEGQTESSDLRRFVKIAKQRVAFVFRTVFRVPATWQHGYYERVLRSDEATDTVVRYVLENPVRAGMVSLCDEYPYCGALYWPEA